MIIANSSPLIVLGRLHRLDILESLFGKIFIPTAVYQETVAETTIDNQRLAIQKSIDEETIIIVEPSPEHPFNRKLHPGEKEVLNLALERKASGIIMDDKRARTDIILF